MMATDTDFGQPRAHSRWIVSGGVLLAAGSRQAIAAESRTVARARLQDITSDSSSARSPVCRSAGVNAPTTVGSLPSKPL